jgi:hypothetical protein
MKVKIIKASELGNNWSPRHHMKTKPFKYVRVSEVQQAFWSDIYHGKPKKYYGMSHYQLPQEVQEYFKMYVEDLDKKKEISSSLAARVKL